MKLIVAVALVIATVSSAEQSFNGYPPSGWRPNGPAFNLPVRARNLNATPSTSYGPPQPAYGPPKQEYGPPTTESEPTTTTTEIPTTTEPTTEAVTFEAQADNFVEPRKSEKLQEKDAEELPQSRNSPTFIVLPQRDRIVYVAPFNYVNAAFVEPVQAQKVVAAEPNVAVPVQTFPAFGRFQTQLTAAPIEAPAAVIANYQKAQYVQFEQLQQVPAVQYPRAFTQSQSWTPYSSTYYQIYQ